MTNSKLSHSLSPANQVNNSIQQKIASKTVITKEAEVSVAESMPKTIVDKPSNFYAKNWDKIVNDFEEEEKSAEGQSIDDLLKDIYSKGNDETRRAISKSFQESNGTVLSTNWSEVSQSTVDVKPPDGCEFKSWKS